MLPDVVFPAGDPAKSTRYDAYLLVGNSLPRECEKVKAHRSSYAEGWLGARIRWLGAQEPMDRTAWWVVGVSSSSRAAMAKSSMLIAEVPSAAMTSSVPPVR